MASCLKVGDEAERRGPNRKSYKRKKNTQRRPAQQDEADKKSKGRWGMWRPRESSSFLPFLEEKDMRSAAEREAQVHVQPVMCRE